MKKLEHLAVDFLREVDKPNHERKMNVAKKHIKNFLGLGYDCSVLQDNSNIGKFVLNQNLEI